MATLRPLLLLHQLLLLAGFLALGVAAGPHPNPKAATAGWGRHAGSGRHRADGSAQERQITDPSTTLCLLAIRTRRSALQHATTKRHPSLRTQLTTDLSPCHNG